MRWKIKNPKQMMTRIAPVARAVFARTAWLGRHVVGEIRWQAPAWPHSVGLWIRAASSGLIAWIQRERKRAAWIAVISVVVIGGGAAGKRWYDHLPKPIEVSFEVTQPARTRIEDPNARPDPVVVTFNASVAPLAGVGKEVKSGIEMSPRVGGNWSWSDDRTLVFTPKADWPVDAEFAVELAKTGLVAEQIRLTQYKLKFRSAPFVATLAEVQFYQDPVDPASKKIVATVNFSHPVDTADFEKHVVLREAGKSGGFLGLGAENTKFRVSYDKLKLNAYVHSEALPIPAKPLRLDLAIEPGARAARGGKPTATALTHTVTVPGLYSLAVQSAVLTQAENQRLEPDRILMVNLSADTHEREVATKVRAWQLPVYHPESKEEDRKQPYRWDDSARIGPEILKQSEAVKLEPVAGEREYVEQHAFKVTAEAGRYLYIRVEKGVKSFGGYGVQPFSVNLARRKLKTIVKAPDLVKPGDTVKFRHSTDRPARIVVFAVDEGILQVARYRTADPLGYFFQKRALEVRTSQILDLILPEFKRFMAAAAPGGDAEGALGKHLNPFKRKRDKPVAYWSGIIDSGPQERELTWQVPDSFNGTLRIMAVAVSDDAIGVFEKKTLSRGDFVLSPNAPTTVTPGDEFDVSVGVANNVIGSGAEAQLTVALATSPHLEVIGEPSVKFKVGELREGVTSFRVRAKDELGSGNLIFTASLAKKSAKIATDMSVRPAQPYFVQLAAGTLHNGSTDVPVTRNLYSHYRKLEAGISYVPLALAHGLVSYLGNFSYSCTEQLVSMGMPALILSERPEFGYVKSKGHRSLARHFPERLGKLKPDTLEALVKPINNGYYNTYSSAQAILALDAYVRAAEKLPFSSLTVSEVLRDGTTRALTLPPTLMPRGSFTPNAAKLQFGNKAELNAYWLVEQSGFDRGLPDKETRNGFEVLREYVDAAGKPVQSVKVGEEVEVRLKFRAIDRSTIDNVALVDLLPGGFDLVLNPRQPASEKEGDQPEDLPEGTRGKWQLPFGLARSTWAPEFADMREDRVVLYGTVRNEFQEFVYRIKATNTGTFTVPPAYGESMYERSVRGARWARRSRSRSAETHACDRIIIMGESALACGRRGAASARTVRGRGAAVAQTAAREPLYVIGRGVRCAGKAAEADAGRR